MKKKSEWDKMKNKNNNNKKRTMKKKIKKIVNKTNINNSERNGQKQKR